MQEKRSRGELPSTARALETGISARKNEILRNAKPVQQNLTTVIQVISVPRVCRPAHFRRGHSPSYLRTDDSPPSTAST